MAKSTNSSSVGQLIITFTEATCAHKRNYSDLFLSDFCPHAAAPQPNLEFSDVSFTNEPTQRAHSL